MEGPSEHLMERPDQRLDAWLSSHLHLDLWKLLFLIVIALAVTTRFVDLGQRVMSHDETTHVYFSWRLEQGFGYQHDPLSHGPLQFHLIALSYFLLGDNDASARVPSAVAGVLAIVMIWAFRRWLGRKGALVAGVMMLISPFMLFYSRYARNESFVVLEAIITVWAAFRYFEDRRPKHLYIFAAALALQYVTKETAYIYVAELMLFLGVYFLWRVMGAPWARGDQKWGFAGGIAVAVLGFGAFLGKFFELRTAAGDAATITPTPHLAIYAGIGALGLITAGVLLAVGQGRRLRTDYPSFDLLVVLGTVTLPQLAALPVMAFGWNPLAYQDTLTVTRTTGIVVALSAVSILVGVLWDWRKWLISAAAFFSIFTVFYTTVFTNPFGFFTGLVGSLGYWLVQQGVQRANQPLYYYILVELPTYEFLPVIGALIAGVLGLRALLRRPGPDDPGPSGEVPDEPPAPEIEAPAPRPTFPYLGFIGYWSVMSVIAFSFAGERMPWLTVHLTLPMILLSGWVFGRFIDSINWSLFGKATTWIMLAAAAVGLLALAFAIGELLGPTPPFAGRELADLQVTSGFIIDLAVAIGAGIVVAWLSRGWSSLMAVKSLGLIGAALLFFLTARAAFRAAYVNYDLATEFLVYAHSARGPKIALNTIHDLSVRTTGGLGIKVAYDNDTSYPFWWYLRNYPNATFYGAEPSGTLTDDPVILAGPENWSKVDSIVRGQYQVFTYNRLWWPMQDYFGLTWDRIWGALSSPGYRQALWQIWFNRDYTDYGKMTGEDFSLQNWNPSNKMRLYVRNDVAALIWSAGPSQVSIAPSQATDPYAKGMINIDADQIVGQAGTGPGQFTNPRAVAVAPDGSIYVADTMNSRVEHLATDGSVLQVWGTFADVTKGPAPGGTFNQPWGIAVAPDGTVYVADTWNHRVQHFTADGTFLDMFGTFGQGENPTAFWGPRDVLVDSSGRIFVTDTGNKRVVVFSAAEQPLTQFGGNGTDLGQLDEPVGLAMGPDGTLYVADTWNQRIQAFQETTPNQFKAVSQWDVQAWFGQSLDNKPYLAASPDGSVCASDPEGFRVLCFNPDGTYKLGWGDYGTGSGQLNLPTGLAFDANCKVWVADSGNNRMMRFDPGLCAASPPS